MPIERSMVRSNWSLWIEGGLLLFLSPFLLFPTVKIELTFVSLLLLLLIWLMPLISQQWTWPATTPFDLIVLCWGLVLILSIIVTADPNLTLPKAAGLILGLGIWRYSNRIIKSRTMLIGAIIFYCLLGAGFILMGVVSANWTEKVPFLSELIKQFPQGRLLLPEAAGVGVHTNQLAGTLIFFLPFLASLLFGFVWLRPSLKIWMAILVMFLISFILLLLTQSRTGWIAFAGCLFLLTLLWWYSFREKPKIRWLLAVVSLAMIGFGISAAIFIGPNRFYTIWVDPRQDTVLGNLGSIAFRQEVWQWAIAAIGDFPFTGIGLGSFEMVIRRFYPVNIAPSYSIAHAHNAYLQIAIDVGLPGFIVYLALVGLMFYVGLQVARRDVTLRPYALGLLGCLAAFHIFGLFDTLALGSKTHLIFWVIFGLITAMHRVQQAQLQDNEPVLSLPQS